MATRKRTQAAVPERRSQGLVLGGVLLLGTGLGIGFFAGQYFPRPLDPPAQRTEALPPATTAGVDTPIPSEVYSFYRMFDEDSAEGVPPSATPSAAVHADEQAAADPAELAAVAPGPEAPEVEEGAPPIESDGPADADTALVANTGVTSDTEAGDSQRIVEPRPTAAPTPANERPRTAEPPMAPTLASTASGQGGTESRVVRRTVQRARPVEPEAQTATPGSTGAPASITRVVRDGQSRDSAESDAASLRSVGLTASASETGDGTWQVVIRVAGNESEVRRQTSLAERRLSSR